MWMAATRTRAGRFYFPGQKIVVLRRHVGRNGWFSHLISKHRAPRSVTDTISMIMWHCWAKARHTALGLAVSRDSKEILITAPKYADELLRIFGLIKANSAPLPDIPRADLASRYLDFLRILWRIPSHLLPGPLLRINRFQLFVTWEH